MTGLGLRQVVERALAEVGIEPQIARAPKGRARATDWSQELKGFGVRHYPSGRKVYIAQARMAGRLRTVTIGPCHIVSRAQATAVARRVLAHALVGHDPASERIRIRHAPLMDDFLSEYWSKCAPRWKPSTYATQTQNRRNHIDGAFAGLHVDEVDEAHVARWFARITDNSGPTAANRCLEILRAAMRKAEAWGYRRTETNPCLSVRPNRKIQRNRFLSHAELARLGEALTRARASEIPATALAATAVTLLVLTGCRVGEIMALNWSDVRGSRLRLRDSKTGPRTIWLGEEARALIAAIPRHPGKHQVFWNRSSGKPLRHIPYHWYAVRAEAGILDVHLHDLRHTFASHAVMGSETLPMIGKLLGHAGVKSTARYSHFNDGHLVGAVERIGCAMELLLRGTVKTE